MTESSTSIPTPETKIIQNGQVKLNVTIYKNTNAESVFLLHGGPGVPDSMIPIVSILHPKYQVISFQQRGTGQSDNPTRDYSVQGYIDDLNAIANLFEISSFHLFGHSFGGLYAQIFADAHPEKVKSMFLCSPSSGTNKAWEATESEVLHYNQTVSTTWEFLQMGWYSLVGLFGYDYAYQNMFYLVMRNYHKGYPDLKVELSQLQDVRADPVNLTRPCLVKYKMLPEMPNPAFPIVITYGASDIYGVSKEQVFARYPTGKAYEIEASGHIPWLHNPTKFTTILNEFYSL